LRKFKATVKTNFTPINYKRKKFEKGRKFCKKIQKNFSASYQTKRAAMKNSKGEKKTKSKKDLVF